MSPTLFPVPALQRQAHRFGFKASCRQTVPHPCLATNDSAPSDQLSNLRTLSKIAKLPPPTGPRRYRLCRGEGSMTGHRSVSGHRSACEEHRCSIRPVRAMSSRLPSTNAVPMADPLSESAYPEAGAIADHRLSPRGTPSTPSNCDDEESTSAPPHRPAPAPKRSPSQR